MLLLLFPHQLFEAILTDPHVFKVILHEHPLYFTQFPFHPEKLALHRKSMAAFAQALEQARKSVEIRGEPLAKLAERLRTEGVTEIAYFELSDDWLERDVTKAFRGFEQEILPSPLFLTPTAERNAYFGGRALIMV